jgi:class 3 adenylate cyclase
MTSGASNVDESVFAARVAALSASYVGNEGLIQELGVFLRSASDDQVVRVNPVRYAVDHGRDEGDVVDLFLHARKAGLLLMEWLYVCRVCGVVVDSFHELNAAGEHFFCKTCIADRETDLNDYVEVAFTVPRAVRQSRFHDPASLSAADYLLKYSMSSSALGRDGTNLREFYAKRLVYVDYVEPGETRTFTMNLQAGFLALSPGPETFVTPSADPSDETLEFAHSEDRLPAPMLTRPPGPLSYRLANNCGERILAMAIHMDAEELPALAEAPPGVRLGNFLSGARLLSTQSFLDLFPTETVMSAGGLAVNHVALLFTDVKGSTALYERVGDMKAFSLVRQHFGILRDVIIRHDGALVKTIGDAVMASFHEPLNAVSASLEILAQIRRFNEAAGEELITLRIGAHVGPCIAVTLNERLDYFGQTVNLAARAEGLAEANEICLTDVLYSVAGVAALVASMSEDVKSVQVRGMDREVGVHVLRQPDS